MELHQALTEIACIRRQIAGADKFRGYRAVPVAVGALVACVGAVVQAALLLEPSDNLPKYLVLWISVAIVAGGIPAIDVWLRHRQCDSLKGALARLAFEQFAPCVVAGAMVTAVIACFVPGIAWMLPGFWAVIYSLGLFASFRLLPKAIVLVASWYLLAGCYCLALGPEQASSALSMGLTFGVGQAAMALVLLRQERESGNGQ